VVIINRGILRLNIYQKGLYTQINEIEQQLNLLYR
jgi:hypothetical protein